MLNLFSILLSIGMSISPSKAPVSNLETINPITIQKSNAALAQACIEDDIKNVLSSFYSVPRENVTLTADWRYFTVSYPKGGTVEGGIWFEDCGSNCTTMIAKTLAGAYYFSLGCDI